MVTYTPSAQRASVLFESPFDQHLDPNNRWIRLAQIMPWDQLADIYKKSFDQTRGRPSIDLRIIIGTLFIQHIEHLADERVIPYIQENVYCQAFLGLTGLQLAPVFDPSLLVTIRRRLGERGAKQLGDVFVRTAAELLAERSGRASTPSASSTGGEDPPSSGEAPSKDTPHHADHQSPSPHEAAAPDKPQAPAAHQDETTGCAPPHQGTLIVDATVSPANIAYPTDTALINACRTDLERLIDVLYAGATELWPTKPRTYRRVAHTEWLAFAKSRRKSDDQIKRQRKASLAYVKRNLTTVNAMLDLLLERGVAIGWQPRHWQRLWVVTEVYAQQRNLYAGKSVASAVRIVSVHQAHVRAIKRGKSGGRTTEFGPKYNASMTGGLVSVELASFNNFAEAHDLEAAVEGYRAKFGCYPKRVLGDGAYFTRANRAYLRTHNIEHNGVRLGPKKKLSKAERAKNRRQHAERQLIEGKFGEVKTRYGLGRLSARGAAGQLAQLSLAFMAANAQALLRLLPVWLMVVGLLGRGFAWLSQSLYIGPRRKGSTGWLAVN